MSKCPNCGQPLDDNNLFQCPHCHIDVPTYIKVNLDNLKKSQDFLDGYKQRVYAEVDQRVKAQIWKYMRLLTVAAAAGLVFIYAANTFLTQSMLTLKLAQQFKQPYIREVMVDAAKTSTEQVIKKEVYPQIEGAKALAAKELSAFRSFLEDQKVQAGMEYDAIAGQAAILKERNRMAQLANIAIAEGNRGSFEELENTANNPNKADLAEVASAEIMRVKAFYATDNNLKNEPVEYSSSAGIVIVDDKIPTATLVADLKSNPDWRVRAKFAELLGNRKESGVPEALLEAAASDRNLNVVKAAIGAFSSLTGFRETDIFDHAAAMSWWQKNRK